MNSPAMNERDEIECVLREAMVRWDLGDYTDEEQEDWVLSEFLANALAKNGARVAVVRPTRDQIVPADSSYGVSHTTDVWTRCQCGGFVLADRFKQRADLG